MTAGNDRALWWRPPTRAAWRVQQRALARVKWAVGSATGSNARRRMDSTTGELDRAPGGKQASKHHHLQRAAIKEMAGQRIGWIAHGTFAPTRRKLCNTEKRKLQKSKKPPPHGKQEAGERDRRAQRFFFWCCQKLQNSCLPSHAAAARASGEVRWPGTWRAVRWLQPTSAGQMMGWGREGARVGKAGECFGTARCRARQRREGAQG
jgi:hypothetical protein